MTANIEIRFVEGWNTVDCFVECNGKKLAHESGWRVFQAMENTARAWVLADKPAAQTKALLEAISKHHDEYVRRVFANLIREAQASKLAYERMD